MLAHPIRARPSLRHHSLRLGIQHPSQQSPDARHARIHFRMHSLGDDDPRIQSHGGEQRQHVVLGNETDDDIRPLADDELSEAPDMPSDYAPACRTGPQASQGVRSTRASSAQKSVTSGPLHDAMTTRVPCARPNSSPCPRVASRHHPPRGSPSPAASARTHRRRATVRLAWRQLADDGRRRGKNGRNRSRGCAISRAAEPASRASRAIRAAN